jgi:hypothetical protein
MNPIPSANIQIFNALSAAAYAAADELLPTVPAAAAVIHEDGLILELLVSEGLQPKTLSAIRPWTDLHRGDRGYVDRLFIPGTRVKNGKSIEHIFPSRVGRRIGYHLMVFWPALPGSGGNVLFPGYDGCPATTQQIRDKATRLISAGWLCGIMR